jgi:hypothetical protein
MRSQEYKKRTSTDVGVGGLFMGRHTGARSMRPIRVKQRDKVERVENSAKPGAYDSDFSITTKTMYAQVSSPTTTTNHCLHHH